MSKAILVVDMPDSCIGCPLCQRAEDNIYYCMATFKIIVDVWLKAHWCSLREVPQKKEYDWERYNKGYNACIDEIMKGSE